MWSVSDVGVRVSCVPAQATGERAEVVMLIKTGADFWPLSTLIGEWHRVSTLIMRELLCTTLCTHNVFA